MGMCCLTAWEFSALVLEGALSVVLGSLKIGDSLHTVSHIKPWNVKGYQCHHPVRSQEDPHRVPGPLYLAAVWPWQAKGPLENWALCLSLRVSILSHFHTHILQKP